jgi:menaquinone-dependent protoporphyrinogen oxidase
MKVLIVFGTNEGHTGDIARFVADRLIAAGHEVCRCDAARRESPDPARFDAVLVAASLHLGRYQASVRAFARRRHAALGAMKSAFVSVSLSAAGDDPRDRAGLGACLRKFEQETQWRPGAVHQAAGAMPFPAYGYLTKLAIRFIAQRRGLAVKMSQDYDLTDYPALAAFVDGFAAEAAAEPQPVALHP